MGGIGPRRAAFLGVLAVALPAAAVQAQAQQTFQAGSLIIPMDLEYQDRGLLQAYGLVFQLLRQQVHVSWVIDPAKTWHAQPCDTAGDECAWDCGEEGSAEKCAYPTASPDFYAATTVVWDGEGQLAAGAAIASHGYRGGPFVIAAVDRDRALAVIDVWNDQARWTEAANAWAQRTVFHVVSVHEASEPFNAHVRKEMVAAPTIAVFSDGSENVATAYLRAAGIPQSSEAEFPANRCGADDCGAGTANPDMLTVASVAGDMGTCDAPNLDHRNGQLFRDGVPAYCQIMSMHWAVTDRETVECGGAACPDSQAACAAGTPITYHGHEVVAEVRAFLDFPVHFFAECQAVNAYENTVANPDWPFLDDAGREGHFLTTTGDPPDCGAGGACADGELECVAMGCDASTRDCCLPSDIKELGAGFMIAAQPNEVQVLHPEVPYNQMDGEFGITGGSEPAYNLSASLGTAYKNDLDVTFITGPDGPGVQDVWMTGYLDGACDIVIEKQSAGGSTPQLASGPCGGKVSYLGGHSYGTNVPVSGNANTQGTRLFLNALFEADCVTSDGQPQLAVTLAGDTSVAPEQPQGGYVVGFTNSGTGTALDAVLRLELPAGVTAVDAGGGTVDGSAITWAVGSVGAPASGTYPVQLAFPGEGAYTLRAELTYTVGATTFTAGPVTLGVGVGVAPPTPDAGLGDGDGGSGDGDGGSGGGGDGTGGCDCRVASAHGLDALALPALLGLAWVMLLVGRGRRTRR